MGSQKGTEQWRRPEDRLPEYGKETHPLRPTKLSMTATLKMDKKQRKEFRRFIFPLTRPAHISPKKRVKWRLQQKWFNRYEKPQWIGRNLMAETKVGFRFTMRVTDIRRKKAGGHRCSLDIDTVPIKH